MALRKEQCKTGRAVRFDDYVYNTYRSHPHLRFVYGHTTIVSQEGIITRYRIIENNEQEYRYTIEFGKRKKIYLTRSKIGVMTTNGVLVYKYPEELELKSR